MRCTIVDIRGDYAFVKYDETGVISVKGLETMFEGLAIGHEVIVKGKVSITKEGGGQLCLEDSEILANNYGSHDYSTASFITGTTIADIKNIADSPAETTKVYVITGTIKVVETAYYSNIYISDGTTDLLLYCSSSSQYSWLKAYAGQTVTIEVAPCNWNEKTSYRGCVLAVVLEDGTKVLNTLNFKK